jgi:hypothetical protein
LERNLSNVICFCLFLLHFSEMLHYIVIKQVDTPVHNCDIGVPLVRLSSFCSEFQNLIFIEIYVRVSSCSNINPFEVRGSTVLQNVKYIFQAGIALKAYTIFESTR